MKLKSLKELRKDTWRKFSIYVRSSKANFQGYTQCYTCYRLFRWKEMDAGHFIHDKLDFNPDNIRPQCTRCNRYLHGNLGEYALHLIQEIGEKAVQNLKKLAQEKGNKYSRQELEEINKKYSCLQKKS